MQRAVTKPVELLAKLVAFDTTSAKSNLELIDFMRDILASHGVSSTLTPSPDGTKASLFATIGLTADRGESHSRDIATAFRSRAKPGRAIRSSSKTATASSAGGAPAT